MDKLTETYRFRLTKQQLLTLNKIEAKGYNVSQFIRLAIKEKIERDFKVKPTVKKRICPFSGQEY